MLESLDFLPDWFVNFWAIYGDVITPVLVTLGLAVISAVALKIKSDAKTNSVKADLQIQALKEVANREDNVDQLNEQNQKIDELITVVTKLSEMFNIAFQNSELDPAIKEALTSLLNKIKYGTEKDLIAELEAQKVQLEEQVLALTDKLSETVTEAAKNEISKRIRR